MRKEESQISKKREKTLSSKEVYKGKILDVFLDEVELPSGRISHREVIRHCHAAAVLAFNDKIVIPMMISSQRFRLEKVMKAKAEKKQQEENSKRRQAIEPIP